MQNRIFPHHTDAGNVGSRTLNPSTHPNPSFILLHRQPRLSAQRAGSLCGRVTARQERFYFSGFLPYDSSHHGKDETSARPFAMTQAVRDLILEPMLELYLPPTHLRADAQARERALAAYEQALARFDRDTLQHAWDRVVADQAFWVWPNPGTIVAACRQCEPRTKPPGEEEQRQAKALAMAEEYAGRYMKTSQVAKLAKREGWAIWLREYVADAAWVQAQLICKVQHIGWNAKLADGLGHFSSSAEAFEQYRRTPAVVNAVERGQVRIHIPAARIREWKEHCRLPAQEQRDPIPLANTGTDRHIR
jgi:hypothetical protein